MQHQIPSAFFLLNITKANPRNKICTWNLFCKLHALQFPFVQCPVSQNEKLGNVSLSHAVFTQTESYKKATFHLKMFKIIIPLIVKDTTGRFVGIPVMLA